VASIDLWIIIGPILIVVANVIVYLIMGSLGKRSSGSGNKFAPFTGGEEHIPTRGTYHSGLFVFATLFLVVEVFALLLSGTFTVSSTYYPLLFLIGGSGTILVVMLWFLKSGVEAI
jgi:NADH:ubiquinone oxidoreductase subunit 3 (subunit A)